MKPKMITRVTTTEFETDDGVIHDIPFELDGTPRKEPKAAKLLPNWWDYEVKSFNELCKIAKQ